MADVVQQIVLSGSGGDASAAEIQKASNALNGVTSSSSAMQEQFSHKFSHIGLQTFAGDLLKTNGLGSESRQMIGLLQMSIMGAGEAFGAAAGPVILIGSALMALVGIIAKVVEGHGEETAAIQKTIDTQTASVSKYNDEISALQKYKEAGGTMTTQLTALMNADKAVADDIKGNLLVQTNAEIVALEKQRDELGRQQSIHNAWAAAVNFVKTSMVSLIKEGLEIFAPEITYAGEAVLGLVQKLASLAGTIGQHVTLTGQFKQKYDELTASIAKAQLTHSQMAAGVTTDLKTMAAQQQNYRTQVEAMYLEMNKTRENAIAQQKAAVDAENAHELAIMDDHVNKFIEAQQAQIAANEKAQAQMEATVKKFSTAAGNDVGSAFAQMIVAGESFSQAMDHMMQQVAEQFIERVISMVIQWAVLQAVMDIWPGGAQAYQATAQAAYPAVSQAAYNSMGYSAAEGGEALVNQPTLFIAGDNGPEVAKFTPLKGSSMDTSGSGSGGGGGNVGSVNISLNVDHIEGNDPESTLIMLSDQIRRETAAGRQFAVTVAGVAARYPNQAY